MEENTQHIQHIMLYYFKKGKSTTETHKEDCAVCGEGAVTDQTCQKWFAKFHAGDFSLDDAPQSGRLVEVDRDQIQTLTKNNPCYTRREDSRHTQNIQINKVIDENEQCLLFFGKN